MCDDGLRYGWVTDAVYDDGLRNCWVTGVCTAMGKVTGAVCV